MDDSVVRAAPFAVFFAMALIGGVLLLFGLVLFGELIVGVLDKRKKRVIILAVLLAALLLAVIFGRGPLENYLWNDVEKYLAGLG